MRASIRFVNERSSSAGWGAFSGVVMPLLSARHPLAVNPAATGSWRSARTPKPSAQCLESPPRLLRGARAEIGSERTRKPPLGSAEFADDQ